MKKHKNLNTKQHLLQNDQNADTTFLHSPSKHSSYSTCREITELDYVCPFDV